MPFNSHVISIDYRGFGNSTPEIPTEKTLRIDALSTFDWIVSQGVRPDRIVIVGHSLGSGVAADLAYILSKRALDEVVFESSYLYTDKVLEKELLVSRPCFSFRVCINSRCSHWCKFLISILTMVFIVSQRALVEAISWKSSTGEIYEINDQG